MKCNDVDTRAARSPRSRAGLTLIELMIALMILSFGLLAMANVQLESMRGSQRGRHFTQASVIAASQLERLQGLSWASIPVAAWTAPGPAQAVMARTEPDVTYTVQWRVTAVVPGRVRAIDVRVAWTEASGRARQFTLSGVRNNFEAL